jgi:hypothetical protein
VSLKKRKMTSSYFRKTQRERKYFQTFGVYSNLHIEVRYAALIFHPPIYSYFHMNGGVRLLFRYEAEF